MTALLEVSGVTKSFDGFRAINNLSFSIGAAELRAVIGPNGAGKSTLLRAAAGLLPHHGEVTLDGNPLTTKSARERARAAAGAVRVVTA